MEESGNPQENILEAVEKEAQWALCLLGEEEEEEKMERKERRGKREEKERREERACTWINHSQNASINCHCLPQPAILSV